MSKMKRFLIAGSRNFNNYYIVYRYLQRYLPMGAVICNGGSNGADQLARCYAELNGHIYEDYPAKWERFGKKAGSIRNEALAKMVDHAIFFWDGQSPSTAELIEYCKKQGVTHVIIDITEDDIVKPHPTLVVNATRDPYDIWIGRGNGSVWGNPYAISDTRDREYVIAMYTDFFLKQDSNVINNLESLKGKVLGCNCAPNLCHGDMLVWMIDHVLPELKELCSEKDQKYLDSQNITKKPVETWQDVMSRYSKNGSRDDLVTIDDFPLSKGYSGVVLDGKTCYVEISDKDILKNNLWMSMDERQKVADEDPTRLYYKCYNKAKTVVFFQQQGFADSAFRTGMWYVRATDVKPLQK